MEMMDMNFWCGKRVFVTGHTGFKGSWLTALLSSHGAKVFGLSLPIVPKESFFSIARMKDLVETSFWGDIRNPVFVHQCIDQVGPEIVIHLAAQPLVIESYTRPLYTFEVNILGTANILEACAKVHQVKVVLNVTTDKCYKNIEQVWGYKETDPLGGHDPYSASKACSELITSSLSNVYRDSCSLRLITARAGNVIGGGDFTVNRLVPDLFRAVQKEKPILVRNPTAVRPWQHVIEPLYGYCKYIENAYSNDDVPSSLNFGPEADGIATVRDIIDLWNNYASRQTEILLIDEKFHETSNLRLDISLAKSSIQWSPKLHLSKCIEETVLWYKSYIDEKNMKELTFKQINSYLQI